MRANRSAPHRRASHARRSSPRGTPREICASAFGAKGPQFTAWVRSRCLAQQRVDQQDDPAEHFSERTDDLESLRRLTELSPAESGNESKEGHSHQDDGEHVARTTSKGRTLRRSRNRCAREELLLRNDMSKRSRLDLINREPHKRRCVPHRT